MRSRVEQMLRATPEGSYACFWVGVSVVGIAVCCVNDEGLCSATKQEPASWLSGEALHLNEAWARRSRLASFLLMINIESA